MTKDNNGNVQMHDDICVKCGEKVGSQSNTERQIFRCYKCWKGEQIKCLESEIEIAKHNLWVAKTVVNDRYEELRKLERQMTKLQDGSLQ